MDKIGKSYWDSIWEQSTLPSGVNPRARDLNNYVNLKFHEYFLKVFSSLQPRGKKLLEIGCAQSAWLPYFAREFGCEVCGLDYSQLGCKKAKAILGNEGVIGEVVCADFFSPPAEMIGGFDVVVSFGVVEHFSDTSQCLSAIGRFLRPGGLLVTSIPNMNGINGVIQKLLARAVFDIHVPLSCKELVEAHQRCGMEVTEAKYFLPLNLSAINVESRKGSWFYVLVTRLSSWISKSVWLANDIMPLVRPNRWTSPFINCLARKACARPA